MTKIKVSELIRMSGLNLEELTAKFKQANITIDDVDSEIEITPEVKDLLLNKKNSATISLKRPKLGLGGSKLKLKKKPDVKVIQENEGFSRWRVAKQLSFDFFLLRV